MPTCDFSVCVTSALSLASVLLLLATVHVLICGQASLAQSASAKMTENRSSRQMCFPSLNSGTTAERARERNIQRGGELAAFPSSNAPKLVFFFFVFFSAVTAKVSKRAEKKTPKQSGKNVNVKVCFPSS